MTLEELMRMVDSLADAAFATGQAQAGIRPVCVLPDTKHLRRRIEHALIPLCTELAVMRGHVKAEVDLRRPQPIETAPERDEVLLFGSLSGRWFIGAWCDYRRINQPCITHWAPLPSRPDSRASWNPPSNYSDAYDWHQYIDKPEEKEQQPVNGPGTAVDSRSAARISSLVPNSQPSGIVSSGVSPPSRATHTDTIIGLCNKCGGQVADACDVIGRRRPAPTCLHCWAMAPQPTQIRQSMFGPLVMMGEPPKNEVWAEDIWRLGPQATKCD